MVKRVIIGVRTHLDVFISIVFMVPADKKLYNEAEIRFSSLCDLKLNI